MEYINFSKNKQTSFLRLTKIRTNLTWKQIAHFLEVNRSMIYFYLNEHSRLPYDHYVRLCSLAKINIDENIETINIKNKENIIKIPKLSTKLAEFLGALAGDGHVNTITYEVSISMDKDLDCDYSYHIIKLFNEILRIEARKYTQEKYNKTKCFVYSKKLVEFLSQNYDVPIGKKKGKLKIPKKIMNDESLLQAYIRGIFDTDGTFHRHHERDAMSGIISKDTRFINEIRCALTKLNYKVSLNNKNLYIYRREHIDRFFKKIKPSNKKHLMKYLYYKKHGKVPLTKEILKR